MKSYKTNDLVETKHGEKLKVLEIRTLPAKKKLDKVLVPERTYLVAMSGDHLTAFPVSRIRKEK